jgi:multiple sugar transport system substrate-binding protein
MPSCLRSLAGGALICATLALSLPAMTVSSQAATLRVTVAEYSAKTGPYFNEVARAFEKDNPGTTVQIEIVPWDVLRQKLDTDIAAGANADLAIIGTRWLIDFVKADLVEPLDGALSAEVKGRFIEPFLKPSNMSGKLYGLPVAASARALYYNKDVLAKAGVAGPPATWDELVDAAKKIKAQGGDIAGFGLQGKEIETDVYFYYAMWSYGGEIIEGGKSGLHSAAALSAASLYKSLIDQGLTEPGVTAYNREDVQNLFKKGRVGMMISAPFLASQIKTEAPNLKYGIVPVPKGTTSASYGVTDSIIAFKNSKAKAEGAKFLEYMFRPEWRQKFDINEGFLPVTSAVAALPQFKDDPDLKAFASVLPNARFAPVIPGWEEIAETTGSALQKIYLGQGEAKVVLGDTAAKIDGVLGAK